MCIFRFNWQPDIANFNKNILLGRGPSLQNPRYQNANIEIKKHEKDRRLKANERNETQSLHR